MKKLILLFTAVFLMMGNTPFAQSTKAKPGETKSHQIFKSGFEKAQNNYSDAVTDGVIVTFDEAKVAAIYDEDPQQIEITIPFKTNGKTITLELYQKDIFSSDFKAMTSDGQDITDSMDHGKHYRGTVNGKNKSLVSISIFRNEVIGFISYGEGNYSIGRLNDSNSKHIIYKDNDLLQSQDLNCSMESDGVSYTPEELASSGNKDLGDCVNVYVEAGQSVYNSFGGNLVNTTNFLTGVFGQSFVIYANEGITMQISSMLVWTTVDPYNTGNTGGQLSLFQGNTGAFAGDIGHLVEVQNIGGLAAGFSGICNPNTDRSLCFSGFSGTSYNNVPTVSFNVYLITHEMGHLLGSRHTHACVWNGNSTAIDGCSGFTEGGCALPASPAGGGTIMSYCINSVGLDFTQGFGPQPGNVIRNNVNAPGNCLSACGSTCTTSTTLTGNNLGGFISSTNPAGLLTSTATMGQTGKIGTDWDIESVNLDLTHTFDGDLIIDLVAPDGTTLNLSDGNGGSDNDYISTVFMDGGASIVGGTGTNAPFTNTYEPQGGTFASAFDGVCVMGDWRLNITDQFGGDDGTLNNFEITFCGSAGPPCCVTADEAPMLDTPCPGDIELCGAQNVSWTEPTATDNCDTPTMTRSHAPGDAFAVGTTTVTYTFEDLAGLTVSCSFDVVINTLPVVAINDSNLPAFCQGVKSLSVRVMNEGDLTAPITYAWSHSLGSGEEVVVSLNNTTYSVTVTDGNNCSSVATFLVNVDASNLLSAHVLVGDDELEMTNTEVLGGGVGMMDGDEVSIEDNSTIHTFLESEEVSIDGSSSVANHIDAPSTLGLPAFSYNTFNDNNNVTVPFGGAMTLSGSHYGVITVMNYGTLTFDNPTVYVKKLITKTGATIVFTGSTNVMVKQDVKIGSRNTVNAANVEVVMYIGDDLSVSQGSTVILDVFAQEGIEVNEEGSRETTYMTGLFISNDGVQSGDEVVWNWNLGCSAVAPAPLMAAINTDEVGTSTIATKNLDIYPNPSNGSFTLNTEDYMDKTIDIVIYNTIGEVVWKSLTEKVETPTRAIDLSNVQFANGIYLISVASEGKVEAKSLVLNR